MRGIYNIEYRMIALLKFSLQTGKTEKGPRYLTHLAKVQKIKSKTAHVADQHKASNYAVLRRFFYRCFLF